MMIMASRPGRLPLVDRSAHPLNSRVSRALPYHAKLRVSVHSDSQSVFRLLPNQNHQAYNNRPRARCTAYPLYGSSRASGSGLTPRWVSARASTPGRLSCLSRPSAMGVASSIIFSVVLSTPLLVDPYPISELRPSVRPSVRLFIPTTLKLSVSRRPTAWSWLIVFRLLPSAR